MKEKGDIPELVSMALKKLNSIPGANKVFFARFKKSRALVYFWKSGRTIPSAYDFSEFMNLVTDVVNECQAKYTTAQNKMENAKAEFKNLLSV